MKFLPVLLLLFAFIQTTLHSPERQEALRLIDKARYHYQFAAKYQYYMSQAIKADPDYSEAYRAKSVGYLKSGDFLTWKHLIDKAVQLDSVNNLGYRAWCRYQFFRDYEGTIQDLDKLEQISPIYREERSANGDYELAFVKGMCYKALGNNEQAIQIMEEQINWENYYGGLYDFIHLGVAYLHSGQLSEAIQQFYKQENFNDLAENHYYLAKVYQQQNNIPEAREEAEIARRYYLKQKHMHDVYTQPMDQIDLIEIKELLQDLSIQDNK